MRPWLPHARSRKRESPPPRPRGNERAHAEARGAMPEHQIGRHSNREVQRVFENQETRQHIGKIDSDQRRKQHAGSREAEPCQDDRNGVAQAVDHPDREHPELEQQFNFKRPVDTIHMFDTEKSVELRRFPAASTMLVVLIGVPTSTPMIVVMSTAHQYVGYSLDTRCWRSEAFTVTALHTHGRVKSGALHAWWCGGTQLSACRHKSFRCQA